MNWELFLQIGEWNALAGIVSDFMRSPHLSETMLDYYIAGVKKYSEMLEHDPELNYEDEAAEEMVRNVLWAYFHQPKEYQLKATVLAKALTNMRRIAKQQFYLYNGEWLTEEQWQCLPESKEPDDDTYN